MEYKVDTKDYQGPMEKLLDLVEEEELDISLLSLAEVTGDFLSYLEKLKDEDLPHRVLADFLVIASKLLLIKSKLIIPALDFDEDEEDIEDLEIQLKLYKRIKSAKTHIEENWSEIPRSSSRSFLQTKETIFHPYSGLTARDMRKALEEVIDEIQKLMPVEEIETEIVSLKSKIQDVLNKLSDSPSSIHDFSDDKGSKSELVALFLAVLHLFKDELIEVEQSENFGDIQVVKKDKKDEKEG